ncbi:hypothetical protein BHM03_00032857 [Ensete ventricosum]|nr:hypothetical protein BHM03_00032857 [Ensete ventricosum]
MEKKTITRRNPIKQEHRRRRASRLPTTPPAEARQKQRSQDALQNIPSPKQRLRAGFVRRWAFGPRHCRHGEEAKPRKDDVTAAESSLVVCFELPIKQEIYTVSSEQRSVDPTRLRTSTKRYHFRSS